MMIFLLMVALLVSLAMAAFCAGIETGFTSLNRGRVVHMAREGSARAKIVEQAVANMQRTLTGLLVGNNLASVGFSAASSALAAQMFASSTAAITAWSFCAACTMLYLGEFLPKLFCSTRPLWRTLRAANAYRIFSFVFAPLTWIALLVTGLFVPNRSRREQMTPDGLLRILQDRKDGVKLTDFESALIARILVLRMKGEQVTPDALMKALDEVDDK